MPFSEVIPSMIRRSAAKCLTACSALLLFHGTPSKIRKVKSLSQFFFRPFLDLYCCFALQGYVRDLPIESINSR